VINPAAPAPTTLVNKAAPTKITTSAFFPSFMADFPSIQDYSMDDANQIIAFIQWKNASAHC
jgi:hypothetical protein